MQTIQLSQGSHPKILNFALAKELFFFQCLFQFYEGCGSIREPEKVIWELNKDFNEFFGSIWESGAVTKNQMT